MKLFQMNPFYIHLLLTILWFILMTWLSHQDGDHTGKTSLDLAIRMKRWFPVKDIGRLNRQLRRAAHVTLFAVFALLLTGTLKTAKLPAGAVAAGFVLTVFWAWADEATKPIIPGRHFSWFDVRLNWIGTGIGILSGLLLYR